jgi:CubicO group peptidase (beta-lactamase class C family)
MTRSLYADDIRLVRDRANGYSMNNEGIVNTAYLSMTQPYAAGGLVSNVDDLARWDAALTAGTLLAPETLQRAWTPFKLTDGKASNYGYGWGIGTWQGSATVEHGGGIHGFLTYAIRIPDEHVFVAVLSNNTGAPHIELLALRMAGLALGRPYVPPASIEVEPDRLDQYVGVYALEQDQNWTMTRQGDKLMALRSGWSPLSLMPIEPDTFCIDDMPLLRFIFTPIANGGMRVEVHDRSGPQETATRNE